ncbi:MAG: tetratricopeptide repeat protein [Pseudomonadota bacterium]
MATVSSKFRPTLAASMLVSVLVSGCSSVVPVKPQAKGPADGADAVTSRQAPIVSPAEAPLPRQVYNPAGEKVPYVPIPNPYTTGDASVPGEAKSIFVVASDRLQAGDLKGASAKFRMLTEKYPSLAGPWVKLGAIAEKQEKYTVAIERYKKAISVNRNNVNAYIALGLVQRRQGYFSDAQHTYLDALRVWRDFPEAHLNLAVLYDLYLNKAEAAQKHYEAYYFLTGEKDEKVHKWLVEVKHRTGIDGSFIDVPPAKAAKTTAAESDDAVTVAATKGAD